MNLKYTKKLCFCEARKKRFSLNFIEKQSYEFIDDTSSYTPEECDEIVANEVRKQLKREDQVTGDELGYIIKDAELNVWEEIN